MQVSISTTATTSAILAAYNQYAPTPRKAFKTKADAVESLVALVAETTDVDWIAAIEFFPTVLSQVPTKKPGRRTDLTNATIHTTATPNPARPRTMRHERFNILATLDGKTVEDYYQACRDAGIPCSKNNPVQAVDKGFITLSLDGAPFMAVAA